MDVCAQVKMTNRNTHHSWKQSFYVFQNLDEIHFIQATSPSNHSLLLLIFWIIETHAKLRRNTEYGTFSYLFNSEYKTVNNWHTH